MRGAAEGFFAVVADRAGRIDQLFDGGYPEFRVWGIA